MGFIVRLVKPQDAKIMTEQRNKHRKCFFDHQIITEEMTKNWIATRPDNDYMYIVLGTYASLAPIPEPRVLSIGQFSIYNIDMVPKTAEFGRIILYKKGYRKEFLKICREKIDWFKKVFNLRYIELNTYTWNKSAITFFGDMGFVATGEIDSVLQMRI